MNFYKYNAAIKDIKMDDINTMTAELKKEARKHNGVYGGWEAAMKVKGQK